MNLTKSLIIGMGSTGKDICIELANHLRWRYGSLDAAKWVKILVFETDGEPDEILGDRLVHIGINKGDYEQYIKAPKAAGKEFGFPDWQVNSVICTTDNTIAGAGGTRMLGRLSLYHHYDKKVKKFIQDSYKSLQDCSNNDVADALNIKNENIDFYKHTFVYVVGTLVGGTSSGCCVDMGYLTKYLTNNETENIGIFTIPASGGNPRFKKNSFEALKELNHFMLQGNTWSQTLPEFTTDPLENEMPPYNNIYITQAKGDNINDIKGINRMIANFLATSNGVAGHGIAATNIDGLDAKASDRTIGYLSPQFSTMGIASMEYPAEHIRQAATERLIAKTLEMWLSNEASRDELKTARGSIGPSSLEEMAGMLINENIIGRYLNQLQENIPQKHPKSNDLDKVISTLTDIDSLIVSEISGGIDQVPDAIMNLRDRKKEILDKAESKIKECLNRYLLDINGGPDFILSILDAFQSDLEGWENILSRELDNETESLDTIKYNLNKNISELRKELRKKVFKNPGIIDNIWNVIKELTTAYIRQSLKLRILKSIQDEHLINELLSAYNRHIINLRKRLHNASSGFHSACNIYNRSWRQKSKEAPSINGILRFDTSDNDATGTVYEVYKKMLVGRAHPKKPSYGWELNEAERAACQEVIAIISSLPGICMENGSSLDRTESIINKTDYVKNYLNQLNDYADDIFRPLHEYEHILKYTDDNDIVSMIQGASPVLQISPTLIPPYMADSKDRIDTMTMNVAFAKLYPTNVIGKDKIDHLCDKINTHITLYKPIFDNDDPFRIITVSIQHGFTLANMKGVVKANAADAIALEASDGGKKLSYWNSRVDIDWINPLISPLTVKEMKEDWLQFLLLGKNGIGDFDFLPSGNENWYEQENGELKIRLINTDSQSDNYMNLDNDYNKSIGQLLSDSRNQQIINTCQIRIAQFRSKYGSHDTVNCLLKAWEHRSLYSIASIDKKELYDTLRFSFYRYKELEDAFFDIMFPPPYDKIDVTQFSSLYKFAGTYMQTDKDRKYTDSGYYCKNDCYISKDIKDLIEKHFDCDKCGLRKYWP